MNTERERDINELTEELQNLALRTRQVEEKLQSLRQEQEDKPTGDSDYKVGDTVTIINQVRKTRTWTGVWNPAAIIAERRATVTHIVEDQVWIVTENGTETWRARHNLQQRRNDE